MPRKPLTMPAGYFVDQLKRIVSDMEIGDYAEVDMATLITRDRDSGLLTIVSMKEDEYDQDHKLLGNMAKVLGYVRIN